MNRSIGSRLLTLVFVVMAGVFLVARADAQKPKTRPTPKPLATPVELTGAEIISQGSDYNSVPVDPPPAEKTADKPATTNAGKIKELNERIKKLESSPKNDYDEKQKRMLLNLDILTRAEQRSESLRKQLFEMIEKENSVKGRLDQIEYDIRPDSIERTLQMNGSMRPEEVRDAKRKSLEAERTNLQALLREIQLNRANLADSLGRSDIMVEKLRAKLEKDINDSFLKDEPDQ